MTAPRVRAFGRDRLLQALRGIVERRVALVVAPAGSGKTTLLAQFAAASPLPVAWYRAESDDADAATLVSGLGAALADVLGTTHRAATVDGLVAAADASTVDGAVLVVDDVHTISGSESEAVLERLLEHAPPALRLIFASRSFPSFNLSRLRVSGDPIEIGADDLRFRTWEVECLFRDFYGERLPPEDLAELARRTEGWAAGLQLFHLATRGKPLGERRRIVSQLGSQTGMVREYLARNVLDGLPEELRRFLVDTCVLGRLTGPLCDEFLGKTGSHEVLSRLSRRQIFTVSIDNGAAFRYHEVLRSHLEGMLIDEAGEAEVRRRHRSAGELLQRSGALPEASWAYCRAGDWQSAAHVLGRNGGPVPPGNGSWIDALPPGLLDQDPWMLLAKARRYLALGRWRAAFAAYRSAERGFPAGAGHQACGQERRALGLWLEPSPTPRSDWLGLVRAATQSDPLAAAARAHRLPGPTGRFAEGVAALLAGRVVDGGRLLERVSETPGAGPVVSTLARLLASGAAWLVTGPLASDWEAAVDHVEAIGLSWLGMLLRTTMLLSEGPDSTVRPVVERCDAQGDQWGAALLLLAEGFVRLRRGEPAASLLDESTLRFRRLEAGTLETWATAASSLAHAREGGSPEMPASAGTAAAVPGVPGAQVLTFLARAESEPGRRDHYLGFARATAAECGLRWPEDDPTDGRSEERPLTTPRRAHRDEEPLIALRCFGAFQLGPEGRGLDVTAIKPRARTVLYLLALHAGQPLHRERLVDALWPDAEPHVGIRNLQVVVSTLRRLLKAVPPPAGPVHIAREGDAYRLVLPPRATADVLHFQAAVARARRARRDGDVDGAVAGAEEVLRLYAGDLLPEAGPADWVVGERDRYRREAADTAGLLADVWLERGESDATVEACERGLALDRYRDSLWRTLADAHDRLGDSAAAARARRSYGEVLAELGVLARPT